MACYTKIDRKSKRSFMRSMADKNGKLNCPYCKQKDLIILHGDDPKIHEKHRATLDHIIAVCLGGSRLDRDNWQVVCTPCNRRKGRIEFFLYKALREQNRFTKQMHLGYFFKLLETYI